MIYFYHLFRNCPSTLFIRLETFPFQSSQFSLLLGVKYFKFHKHQVCWMHWSIPGLCWTQAKVLLASEQNFHLNFLKQWLVTYRKRSNISFYGVCHYIQNHGSWHIIRMSYKYSSCCWTEVLRYSVFNFPPLSIMKSPLLAEKSPLCVE